jgi:hypothetical protein
MGVRAFWYFGKSDVDEKRKEDSGVRGAQVLTSVVALRRYSVWCLSTIKRVVYDR